jgi:anti-sigma B factor antagonist
MTWQDAVRPVSVSFDRDADSATTVVTVSGEIDLRLHGRLRDVLNHEVDAGRHLIVDLSDVDFLDSTGLGLLVGVLKRGRERAERLRVDAAALILVITAPEVWRTLQITRLDEVFTVVDRLEDAQSLI